MNQFFDTNYDRRIRYKNKIASVVGYQTCNQFELKSNYQHTLSQSTFNKNNYYSTKEEKVDDEKFRFCLVENNNGNLILSVAEIKTDDDLERKYKPTAEVSLKTNREKICKKLLQDFLVSNHFGSSASYIRISLNHKFYDSKQNYIVKHSHEDDALKLCRRFRNEINQHFFGNKARRQGRDAGLKSVSCIHRENHLHLHILYQIPTEEKLVPFSSYSQIERTDEIEKFVNNFCKKHYRLVSDSYVEQAEDISASMEYNAKNGLDSICDF